MSGVAQFKAQEATDQRNFVFDYLLRGSARSLTWGGLRSCDETRFQNGNSTSRSVIAVTFDGTLFCYGH